MIIQHTQFQKIVGDMKDFPSCVLLVGDEDELIAQSAKSFEASFFKRYGSQMVDFNCDHLYVGQENEGGKLETVCGTLPLNSEKRLVVVHHFERFPKPFEAEVKDYCESPNPSTCLVILWNVKPTQALLGRGLAGVVAQEGTVVKFWSLKDDRDRSGWIGTQVASLGKEISSSAAFLLSKEGGESLQELKTEVDKCVLFVRDRKRIEESDVRETLSFRRNQLIWELSKELESGRLKKAGQILERCLNQGEEPIKILGLVAKTIRGVSGAYGSSRQKKGLRSLKKLFDELENTDLLLKSGHGLESGVLERLLVSYGDGVK